MRFSQIREKARKQVDLERDLEEIQSKGEPNHTISINHIEVELEDLRNYFNGLNKLQRVWYRVAYEFSILGGIPQRANYSPTPPPFG